MRCSGDSGGSELLHELQVNFQGLWHSQSTKDEAEKQREGLWLLGCHNVPSLSQILEAEGFFFSSSTVHFGS